MIEAEYLFEKFKDSLSEHLKANDTDGVTDVIRVIFQHFFLSGVEALRTFQEVPFVSFSNKEVDSGEPIGTEEKCPHCGKMYPVEYGQQLLPDGTKIDSTTLAYVKCGNETFLVGAKGRRLRVRRDF